LNLLGGNGFAEFLLDRASEIANKENLKLASVCYYGIKYIEKTVLLQSFPKEYRSPSLTF
jgi:predicted GNAT family acetyltransferase